MKARYWLTGVVLTLLPILSMGQNSPIATNVSISGSTVVGLTLTGNYTWNANGDSDSEGMSTYMWSRDDDGAGTNKEVITDETSITYTLTSSDEGKYIYFEVTPVDDEEPSLFGIPAESSPVGPVTPNTAPEATGVTFSGNLGNGSILTGSYTYNDTEDDEEGTSTFKWYRADDAAGTNSSEIPSQTSITYTLTPSDISKYISFEVTPEAQTGATPGTAVASSFQGPVAPPQLTISHAGLTENNLDGAIISLTLVNETFIQDGTLAVTLHNPPSITGVSSTNITSTTTATVTLSFDNTDFETDITDFSISILGGELTSGLGIQSNVLTIDAFDETLTLNPAETPITEDNLNDMVINLVLSDAWFADGTLNPSNFTLNNAPELTLISNLEYSGPTSASLTIYYNESDFDTDITNFSISIAASEVTSSHALTSSNYTIQAVTETLQANTTPNTLNERNVNGAEVVIDISGDTFISSLNIFGFDERNEWGDLNVTNVVRNSDTQATITLGYDNDDRDDDKSDFYIRIFSSQLSGSSSISTNYIYLETFNEILTISASNLIENQLDVQGVLLTLSDDEFLDATFDINNFTLDNEPDDLTVESVDYISATSATLNLAFDSNNDFDTDFNNFRITISAAELISGHNLQSDNNLTIFAIVERPTADISGSATICDDGVSTATFDVVLTGAPPWSIRVYRNGSFSTEKTNILVSPYGLEVSEDGTYTIDDVKDSEYTSYDGTAVTSGSAVLSYYPKPTADFSGLTYTVCEGTNVPLQIDLTGTGPWTFTYALDGNDVETISNTSTDPYTINVTDEGQYKITALNDALCPGNPNASSKATIENYDISEANIIGTAEICNGETAELSIVLSGDDASSWNLVYQRDGGNNVSVNGITSSPYTFDVSVGGTYTVFSVSDEHCPGETSGSATITVHPLPSVNILYLQDTYWVESGGIDLTNMADPPDDGPGSWTGTGVSGNTFYPAIAGLGQHLLTYTYEEQDHHCENSDSKLVSVIETSGSIDFVDEPDTVFCNYETPISLLASNTEDASGWFYPFPGLTDNGNNTGFLDPATVLNTYGAGTYTLYYEYPFSYDYVLVEKVFTIEDPGYAKVLDFKDIPYCENDIPFDLEGNVFGASNFEGTGIFTGNGVVGDVGSGFQFDPGDPSVLYPDQGSNYLVYTFTSTNGCIARDSVKVVVNRIPSINFAVADTCLNFVDSTIFVNNSSVGGDDFIQTYFWSFGDNTYSLEEDPAHLYTTSGLKIVKLRATTDKGCEDDRSISINFWDRPIAEFDWNNDCFTDGLPVSFSDQTDQTKVTITDWTWNIYDSGQTLLNTNNSQDMDYVFPESNFYDVELIVNTGKCIDTVTQTINMKPTMRLATSPYMEDFESGEGHWLTEQAEGSGNSWEFGTPAASRIQEAASGSSAWVTNLVGEYLNSETSWITGPCFDFRNTKRPMITLHVFSDMELQRDGAVLQYSLDNGLTWTRVGDADDGKGISWFNTTKIDANPGNEQHGWTGYDSDWKEARHDLDELIGRTDVKFRIIFGSSLDINDEGIGIDNINITERTRHVVLEHFTNMNDGDSDEAEAAINTIANRDTLDVIDIHYHVSFPGADILNTYFPAGPSARNLYYSISDVPYSVMDGKDHFLSTLGVHAWNDTVMIKRALVDPKVAIDLDAEFTGANSLIVTVSVDTLHGFAYNDILTLHLIILEEVVTVDNIDYENVVRGMLPDPGGTQIFDLSLQGTYNLTQTWTFDPIMIDTSMVVVVAFVQDEDTKEVYQTAFLNFGGVATDIGEIEQGFEHLKFNLYPNPVSGEMYLSFTTRVEDRYELEIFNDLGVLIEKRIIPANTERMTLDVGNYAEGVYTAKITNRKDKMGWKRFIVIH